jgi:MFS transporter, FHS family, Na+ dependent glucose transporter 1
MHSDAQRWRSTFGYYGLAVCLGLGVGLAGPTLQNLADQTGSSLESMGLLFLVGPIGFTLGTLLGGRLFDRMVRGHVLLGAAQLVSAVGLAFVPAVHSLWLLLAIAFVRGALDGVGSIGANTLLLWTYREKVSPFMNGYHFSFGVGAFVGPLAVARFVTATVGYRGAYWAVAGFAALAAVWMLVQPGSPDPAEHAVHAARARSDSGGIAWAPIVIAAIYLFAYVSGEISFGSWIASYAKELRVADEVGAAYLTSAFWFSFTIGRLISIPVAVLFTPRQVIPVALVACLGLAGLLMILPLSAALLWAVAIGLGFCMAPLWPSGFTLAGQVITMTASVSALVLLGDSFGGMILPAVTGKLMEAAKQGGPRLLSASLPALVFGSLVVCLAAYVALLRSAARRARR